MGGEVQVGWAKESLLALGWGLTCLGTTICDWKPTVIEKLSNEGATGPGMLPVYEADTVLGVTGWLV